MSGKVAELMELISPSGLATQIATMWSNYYNQRKPWVEEKKELRNYVFATDTRTTSNSTLPWKNSTTLPKLCQIRDNLHSNYLSALMPNDDWVQWVAYSPDDNILEKKNAIEAYISNKIRMGNARQTLSELLLDYIDWGNAFAEVEWVNESKVDDVTGETIQGFIGPRIVRISPHDIVFNPTAARFKDTYKIVRYVKTIGELMADAEDMPENAMFADAVNKAAYVRTQLGGYRADDYDKALGYAVDGFGNMQEYYQSNYVELLRFEGDIYDNETGTLHRNRRIYIIDRAYVLSDEQLPQWSVGSGIQHVGWRSRPENLYAMGPLDNLVGMQYRIDHLENLKADIFDMIAAPPLKIKGDVEEFVWGPNAVIHCDEDGDVQVLAPDTQALNADMQIQILENKMEEFAGAPKQAMGIRTPGEKTAFEVQQLQNAAGRIFQEKITNFEINLLEPILNDMLELSKRHMSVVDAVRVIDDDLGVAQFINVTREDITASGVIRPVGARHFAAQATLVQNLTGVMSGPIGQAISPHISGKKLARMVEDALNLDRFNLIQPNVALFEQQETAALAQQIQQELQVDQMTDEAGGVDAI